MLNDYKLLIFDFDGVIADSFHISAEEYNRLRLTGTFPDFPEIKNQEDMASFFNIELLNSLQKYGFTDAQITEFFRQHSDAMSTRTKEIGIFDDIYEAVKNNLTPKIIITSTYAKIVEDIFAANNITDYRHVFTDIIGKEVKKTKAEKITDVLAKLSLGNHEVLYIGDMANDILNCNRAKIDILAVAYGYHPHEHIRKFSPTFLAHSRKEFIKLLERAWL